MGAWQVVVAKVIFWISKLAPTQVCVTLTDIVPPLSGGASEAKLFILKSITIKTANALYIFFISLIQS